MDVQEVASGVWRAGTRYVNWYLVDGEADGVTVVDSGLPGYRDELAAAVRGAGHDLDDVAAVLVTHGHVDHVGGVDVFGAPVHIHPDDLELARVPRRNRTERPLTRYLAWPATGAFVAHALRNGAMTTRTLEGTVPLVAGDVLEVPGAPRVVAAPGHTPGSCVFEFREHGVAMVGDVLSTVSPVSGRTVPPAVQTRGSSRDCRGSLASLEHLLDLDARILLPGHGAPWHGSVESAVAAARRVGCR